MQQTFYLAVGASRDSFGLPGGYLIGGVTINNPSGSWLYFPQDGTYVPPYTLGFAHSFRTLVARLDIEARDGPAGQVSTVQGDAVSVTVSSDPVGESPGQGSSGGFVQHFTPTLVETAAIDALLTGGNTAILIPGSAGKRTRLLSIVASLPFIPAFISPFPQPDSPVMFGITHNGFTETLCGGVLDNNQRSLPILFGDGLDVHIGHDVEATATAYFAVTRINFFATYQVI